MIYGVGINDIRGVSRTKQYHMWRDMLERCYSPKSHARNPTYVGCSVAPEWHRLSIFWAWAESRWAPGLVLDKDILWPGNKVYGPTRCCFVTPAVNNLLTDGAARRGPWPQGVIAASGQRGFRARCYEGGKLRRLGHFDTPGEAHAVYVEFKAALLWKVAAEQTDPRVAAGLRRHAALMSGLALSNARGLMSGRLNR
jgi:hypothetical protein